jgi:hypothetical protein
MATIYGSDLKRELIDAARIQVSKDRIPSEIAEKVVPVIEVNPNMLRRCNIARANDATNATAATIYATPADKEFWLVSATLGIIKDVTSQSVATDIRVLIDGRTDRIIVIPGISLTPQESIINLNLPFPIKIDKNTNITINNSNATANIKASGCIMGYIVELGS